jgi:hypothetical protein
MKNTNNITNNETAQMMTIEAFLGALLIITAVLFVVSQAPSGVQQADAQSKTQLMHYGEDTIDMLKNSPPPEYTDYDNNLQYYFSEKKFDDLNEFLNDTLPDNVVYNVELYDGGRYLSIIRNGYPSANGISFNEIIITKGAPAGGVGNLTGTYITNKSFDNGSLIIPMDEQQNNNITAYNLILNISDLGIPVYQLLMDPRKESAGDTLVARLVKINTTTEPWGDEESYGVNDYYGGPYVVDAADLTPIIENQIRDCAENPIKVPSCKIDKIEFNDSMENRLINITFTLSNGSTRIVNITTDNFNINILNNYDSGNDSEFLDIDNSSIAFDDCNKSKIIGTVMFNRAPFNLTIDNITIKSDSREVVNITIDGKDYSNPSSIIPVDIDLLHNDTARKVTVHKSGGEINDYPYTTWLTGSPRIAVYPKHGTMRNYYSDSGISYSLLNNESITNGDLRNFDILIIPHTNITEDNMNDDVARNVTKWVSDGGVLLAECASITGIEDRVEDVDPDNHSWYGFIGVKHQEDYNTNNTIQFVGRSPDIDGNTLGQYLFNYTVNDGAWLHPLAQSYTTDGTLPGTDGTVSAFRLNITGFNPKNSIMAVPQNDSGGVAFPKITFIEAPFDKGTVIYLAGHDQSTFSQQRERLIFNSILYSTTVKVYSYGLLEIRITMWYK